MTRSIAGFALSGSLAALVVSLGFALGAQAGGAGFEGVRQAPSLAPNAPGERAAARSADGDVLVVGAAEDLAEEAVRLGLRVVEHLDLAGIDADLYRLRIADGGDAGRAVAALRARYPGAGIDLERTLAPAAATLGAGMVPESWARSVIGWEPAAPDCGHGIRIGMIDASVDVSHPALAGQKIEYRSFHNPERRPSEAVHGTAIAAMLVGRPSRDGWGGILPGAELKAANVFEYNEDGRLVGNAVALLKAVDWMVEEGVKVVNLSMAGQDNKALRYVIERARSHGLVAVAAAGNWGRVEPAYPAAYDDVIAVTAFGRDGRLYDKANRGSFIDFAAPGVEIWTAVPHGGRVQSGTSFAVPYVTPRSPSRSPTARPRTPILCAGCCSPG